LLSACLATLAQAADAPVGAAAAAGDEELTEVVVTGSRLITNGNDLPQPVTIVQTDELLRDEPSSIIDSINNLPVFAQSRSPNSIAATGGLGAGSPGAQQLNLRNLGPNHTLVLLDGQRLPYGTYTEVVDADIIPEMLIARVENVTGGVSAVYGSDAVAGVVNFVVDRNFNGVKYLAQAGRSTHGDDPSYKFGVAAGTSLFGGGAHLEGSYTYLEDDGILDRGSARPGVVNIGYIGPSPLSSCGGDPTNPCTAYYTNQRDPTFSYGGIVNPKIVNGLQTGTTFKANGVLSPFVNGIPVGPSSVGNPGTWQIGGDGYYSNASLKQALTNHEGFARFDAGDSDAIRFHIQGTLEDKQNQGRTGSNILNISNVTLSTSNPFLPANFATAAGLAPGATTFKFSKNFQSPVQTLTVQARQYFINAGLEGKLGHFDWGVDVNQGASQLSDHVNYNWNLQRLAAALDAVPGANGPVCYASTQAATAAQYADCVAFNPFGPTATSAAAINYANNPTEWLNIKNDLHAATGHIGGDLFNDWAGPVGAVVSTEWRRQSLSYTSQGAGQTVNCTGLRAPCGQGLGYNPGRALYSTVLVNQPEASQSVKEAAIEINIPVLKDVFLVKQFDLNLAGRYTNYDTSGVYRTWKGGLNWKINDSVTIRGVTSKDIRAPNLYELFQPDTQTVSAGGGSDLSTNPPTPIPGGTFYNESGGNPNLSAEIGRTKTLGVVFRPDFVPGLSIALDYFGIEVDNALVSGITNGSDPPVQLACYAGNSAACQLIVRNSAGQVIGFKSETINVSTFYTNGEDLEINYARLLFGHPFSFRLFTEHQPTLTIAAPSVGVTESQYAGEAAPAGSPGEAKWRVLGGFTFQPVANLNVNVNERWRSSLRATPDVPTYYDVHVDAVAYTDLDVSYHVQAFGGEHDLYLHVQNLFDKAPPPFGNNNVGYSFGDDPIGRYVTVGVRGKF
jgi:outer membrane receptor protein involved in Fe transport